MKVQGGRLDTRHIGAEVLPSWEGTEGLLHRSRTCRERALHIYISTNKEAAGINVLTQVW